MRKTRPQDYEPNYTPPEPRPETIDLQDVVPIRDKEKPGEEGGTEQSAGPVASTTAEATIPRHHDTMTPWYHDLVETIRKALREQGKEAATHRFTAAEKRALAEIIFTYRQQGLRTSENEIARIAINFAVEDYRRNGQASLLAQVLKELNS